MMVKLSGSYRQYRVAAGRCEKKPDPLDDGVAKALHANRFRAVPRNEKQSVGWSDLDGLVPASAEGFERWCGRILVLGFRVDCKRIPPGALRVRRLELEAASRREVGERIPPERRREIVEKLERELLALTIPATAVVPVLWEPRSGQLLFGATGEGANQAFRAVFRETFGRVAEPVTAGAAALECLRSLGREKEAALLAPASYSPAALERW